MRGLTLSLTVTPTPTPTLTLTLTLTKVLALREKYTESVNMKEGLRQECETLELKSERAKSLVDGLGGERDRWEVSI